MKVWTLGLAGLLLATTALGAVRATLDAPTAATGEPVRLILSFDGQTRENPDLAPLQQDFDILSTSRSNAVQIINGSVSSHTEVQVIIAPKRTGQILVPQITWAGEVSNPVTLIVGAGAAAQQPGLFLETVVDTKEPYVQAGVNVTVRVFAGEQLLQASLELVGNGDVLVQQVGTDRNRQLEKNGRQYDVVERHYVIFPQKSGEVRIPGPQLAGQVVVRTRPDRLTTDPFSDLFAGVRGMAGASKPVRVHGDDIVLKVQPRPAGIEARAWLPARNLTLTEKWHPENAEVHVGDPVTRDLHLQVEGLTSAQLPDLAALMTLPPGLKAYPDQPKLDNPAHGDVVTGTRDQSIAMIAEREGKYDIAPLRVTWWDTASNSAREATLPGRTLTVLPAAGSAASQLPKTTIQPSADASSAAPVTIQGPTSANATSARLQAVRDPWAWATLTFALLWVGTIAAWFVSRRKAFRPSPQRRDSTVAALSGPQARAAFQSACLRNDPQQARHALLAWASVAWPASPPQGLEGLANLIADERISAMLIELDRALYRGAAWDGQALAAAIGELPPRAGTARDGGSDGGGLAPLYR